MDEKASGASGATGEKKHTETLHDGDTQVQVTSDPNHSLKGKVPLEYRQGIANAMKTQSGVFPPCLNPSCRSYGKSHPNCLCYSPGGEADQQSENMLGFAHGGAVHCSSNKMHNPGCEYYADGGEIADNLEFNNNPSLAVDHAVADHGLFHAMTKTGVSKSEDPDRPHKEFLDHSISGKKLLAKHSDNLMNEKSDRILSDHDTTGDLQSHIDEINQNPQKLIDMGGRLDERFPVHKAKLLAKMSNAVSYLNSIKPQNSQGAPLDPVMKPSMMEESLYRRQLKIAQKPSLVLQHAKDGTLIPQDLKTIGTIYPDMAQALVQNATKALIDAKHSGKMMTSKQKRSLSVLMQEPLSFIQTPQAVQAIMKANGGAQSETQAPQGPKARKTSGAELKQINMVNSMLATPLQSQLADKKQ